MKKNILKFIFLTCCIFIFYSCEKDNIETENISNIESRSLSTSQLETNWENLEKITLTDKSNVQLPWIASAVSEVPLETRQDIRKVNGWIFLSTSNIDLGSDYLIFYNRYTGILKIFYYSLNGTLNNNALWTFSDVNRIGLLNQGAYFTSPMNNVSQTEVSVSPLSSSLTLGVSKGWNCVQIPIVYTGKNGYINLSSMVLNVSTLDLTGNYTEKTEGTIIEDHSSNKVKDATNSIAKATGKSANDWVTKKLDDSKKNQGAIFKNVANALASVASGGTTALVKTGLNALFGSFIGSFKKNEPTIQTVELTTTGKLTIEGKITNPGTGMVNSLNGIDASKMGAWNLVGAPQLTPNVTEVTVSKGSLIYAKYYIVDYRVSYQVTVNPDIEKDVDVSTSYSMVYFAGQEWNDKFKAHYNISYQYINNGVFYDLPGIYDNTDRFPTIYQNPSKNSNSERIIKTSYAGAYIVSTGNIIYPYNYNSFYDFENKVSKDMSINNLTMSRKYPTKYYKDVLWNATINGKSILYPGNYGVNITVKMTVKSTGEEIISSRTYYPEYDGFNYY